MKTKKLGDLVRIVGGGTPSRNNPAYWGGDIPWATVKDLQGASLNSTIEKITELGLQKSASNLIPAGTVITATRMALGRAAISTKPMAINQDLKALKCGPELDERFLLHFILANASHIASEGKGATVKGIKLNFLKSLEVPDFPLPEQKRIADILDKADAVRRKRQETLRLADDFLKSTFLEMFGDPVTNPMGWELGVIGDLFESVNYGTSKKAHITDGKFPVLRMGNITYGGGWDFTELKYVDLTEKEEAKHLVYKGQLLFNRTNSKELVGKTAVYREDKPMAFAGYLIRGIAKPQSDTEYISAYLNSKHGKSILIGMCKSIVGMANINAKELQSIPIHLPPHDLQKKFGDIVRITYCKQNRWQESIDEIEALFSALQQKAFQGEL